MIESAVNNLSGLLDMASKHNTTINVYSDRLKSSYLFHSTWLRNAKIGSPHRCLSRNN